MSITFKLNGKSTTVDAPLEMPLLWVLRDVLDLKGTKFGCGMAQCGACTVHVKGVATRSCVTPIAAIKGAEVCRRTERIRCSAPGRRSTFRSAATVRRVN
jgi:isoquinoline 1-oxidoreductase subunit alpha